MTSAQSRSVGDEIRTATTPLVDTVASLTRNVAKDGNFETYTPKVGFPGPAESPRTCARRLVKGGYLKGSKHLCGFDSGRRICAYCASVNQKCREISLMSRGSLGN